MIFKITYAGLIQRHTNRSWAPRICGNGFRQPWTLDRFGRHPVTTEIRACLDKEFCTGMKATTIISPGAVATELPRHITDEESAAGIQQFYEGYAIAPDSFARAVVFAITQPEDLDINEILFRPTRQKL